MKRINDRWNTKLGRWLDGYGVGQLATTLREQGAPVSVQAIYGWISGRSIPQPPAGRIIVRASAGELSLEDVYQHQDEVTGGTTSSEAETRVRSAG